MKATCTLGIPWGVNVVNEKMSSVGQILEAQVDKPRWCEQQMKTTIYTSRVILKAVRAFFCRSLKTLQLKTEFLEIMYIMAIKLVLSDPKKFKNFYSSMAFHKGYLIKMGERGRTRKL